MDFRESTVVELAARVRAKDVSARELTQGALDRIAELNPLINAFTRIDEERALEQAAAVDQIVASGGNPGTLAGIPIGVKDLEETTGYPTTAGSPLLRDAPAAAHDSPHVARLRAAGCVVVGKTNTPEFGWTARTENRLYGLTKNPWNLEHTPGWSSGGSAAAVAAGMVPLATGSDGGGSIRIPSSCCGLSGIKTSLGRVPAGGIDPAGWLDLSTKGPMARRMSDVIAALDAVVGPEPTDLRALPRPEASWPAVLDNPHVPAKIAWSPTLGYAPVDAEVLAVCERALGALESLGAEIIEVETVFDEDPMAPWLSMVGACLLRTMGPHRSSEAWSEVDPVLAMVVEQARSLSAVELIGVFDECHRLNLRLVELFHDVRLLVTPTVAAPPPPTSLGGAGVINGATDLNWVRFTYPFNMTRSPAATVCAGLTDARLPVGIQLVGPQHADLVVLRSAAALEAAIGFDQLAPVGS